MASQQCLYQFGLSVEVVVPVASSQGSSTEFFSAWLCLKLPHSSIQIAARLLRQVILRGPITSGGICDRTSFTRSLDMNRTFQLLMALTGAGSKRMLDRSTECVCVAAFSRTGCQASHVLVILARKAIFVTPTVVIVPLP